MYMYICVYRSFFVISFSCLVIDRSVEQFIVYFCYVNIIVRLKFKLLVNSLIGKFTLSISTADSYEATDNLYCSRIGVCFIRLLKPTMSVMYMMSYTNLLGMYKFLWF